MSPIYSKQVTNDIYVNLYIVNQVTNDIYVNLYIGKPSN